MSDNDEKEETMLEEQQDLFRELSREQTEAEKALEEDQERSAKSQDESDN
ncbi:hypothetical protein HNV11_09900 [Spirosoma taeanense]|uniref:Uncharacterized protein n=1 Tax=Spirosoma taeanense TaxID=2735870 RepID=A0A6M5YA16_9BACT|nr:hypothetical protein [Spirosoma taeanense]QJW89672.1 hypothetical protein HNV11_09900 [Spirosoma taeanense]